MTTTSIPRQDVLDSEVLDLATEIFSTTYGLDWNGAVDLAIEMLPGLLDFAVEWDVQASREAVGDIPAVLAA